MMLEAMLLLVFAVGHPELILRLVELWVAAGVFLGLLLGVLSIAPREVRWIVTGLLALILLSGVVSVVGARP